MTQEIELSLSGQGLLEPEHYESGSSPAGAIERTVYGNVTWRF